MAEIKPEEGSWVVYFVHSRTRASIYWRVDLEAYDWNGACDCEHFKFHCEPNLVRGAKASDDFRCYHIKMARSHVMDEVFPTLLEAIRKKQQPTTAKRTPKIYQLK